MKTYRPVMLSTQTADRLARIKQAISEEAFLMPNRIGMNTAIEVLLDLWEEHTPHLEWVKAKLRNYPKRGRPSLKKRKEDYGHQIIRSEEGAGFVLACTVCGYVWNARLDGPLPLKPCPAVFDAEFTTLKVEPKTKEELLALGFTEAQLRSVP